MSHKFKPMSHSKTGSVTCGVHFPIDDTRGAYCGESPEHPVHSRQTASLKLNWQVEQNGPEGYKVFEAGLFACLRFLCRFYFTGTRYIRWHRRVGKADSAPWNRRDSV